MTTHSHLPHHTGKIHMKASMDSSGGSHTHSMPSHSHGRDQLFMADIAFTYYRGGHLNMIKNRHEPPLDNVTLDDATGIFAKMLSGMVFKDNDLVMFKEGLKQQIESAIEIAIKTFHESR